jgi:SAM-dependent methyltransferase
VTRYDTIGRTYSSTRRTDPRIEARIAAALGDDMTAAGARRETRGETMRGETMRVVNVGAGAGSYEPADGFVVAVDPSVTMLRQRRDDAAPSVLARAEALPFADDTFDAALASLTVHHWDDLEHGLREMRRVARRQVIFFFEPSLASSLWFVGEYFPQILDLASERAAPGLDRLAATLAVRRVESVPVTADCQDGFAGCYWNRPEAYLDPVVQAGISSFAQLDPEVRRAGTEQLRRDLASGLWDDRHGDLRDRAEIDLGYRLLVAGQPLS